MKKRLNKNFLNQTTVYNNKLIEGNKEIKENDDKKNIYWMIFLLIINVVFFCKYFLEKLKYNNDSFTKRLKSLKDINKFQNKKQN